jgi:serine/threonine protein kinase
MIYPQVTQVVAAAKTPQLIKDPFFEGNTVEILASGRPEMYAGGFSQVFSIKKDKEKWAFKVWIAEISKNKERYKVVKPYLQEVGLSYFLDFEYVEGGLLVEGLFLDTLRMRWIDGLGLSNYISMNLKNTDKLERLAANFLKMTDELHTHSISHGDLQHLNIFVTVDEELKLIDYDSICVPEIEGFPDITRGTGGFQHPSRLSSGYFASTRIDYFSELIIYISILAVSENPLLWDTHIVMQAGDRLLFMPEDFLNFQASTIRRDLLLLSDRIKKLVKILDDYLASHLLLSPLKSFIVN